MFEVIKMIGERIKKLRKEKGLTQAEFADALNKTYGLNIERSMISRWESEAQQPMMYSVTCMAKFFGVSVDMLTGASSPNTRMVPVLGSVPAGIPIEAVEEILDWEEISEDMARCGDYFALRIKGDSMEPRMKEGDVVIVRQQETVENGEIAIVRINGDEATMKRFYRSEAGVQLVGTNPAFTPLIYTPEQVEALPVRVLGKVVELRAKF